MRILHSSFFAAFMVLCLTAFAQAEIMTYYGTATITSPANLGVIDLAFTLDVSGTAILHDTSYIMTDKTLLFPTVPPQIGGKDVGPRIRIGKLDSIAFDLTTDDFTSMVSSRTVTRNVTLVSTAVTNSGATLTGTYTETITGLTPQPVTVTGAFILVRPTVHTIVVDLKDQNGDGCIDLNEIRAAGANSEVIEFNDISQALHLYYNPRANLKICTKPSDLNGEQVIKDALNEFYANQKK